jgi:AcrR family transcriptional regulator
MEIRSDVVSSTEREVQKEGRREQILEAALALFLKRGYEGTPLSAVAAAVGISKPGIVHHFPAKEDILKALYYPAFAKVEALLESAPDRRALLEGYLGIMLEDRALTTLVATDLSVLARPEIGHKAVELNERLLTGVAGEGASLEERMRAECALGALRSAVMAFPQAEAETVREVGLRAAEATLAS